MQRGQLGAAASRAAQAAVVLAGSGRQVLSGRFWRAIASGHLTQGFAPCAPAIEA